MAMRTEPTTTIIIPMLLLPIILPQVSLVPTCELGWHRSSPTKPFEGRTTTISFRTPNISEIPSCWTDTDHQCTQKKQPVYSQLGIPYKKQVSFQRVCTDATTIFGGK
ncbi:hypothetical protein BJ742DRAFT_745711 [Cladochytrium replicatum]|nr:hypothetical protein BJ742DRAFT_745711 [Cladochytrium replicatum]